MISKCTSGQQEEDVLKPGFFINIESRKIFTFEVITCIVGGGGVSNFPNGGAITRTVLK